MTIDQIPLFSRELPNYGLTPACAAEPNRFSTDVVLHMSEVLIKYHSIGYLSPSVLRGTNDGRIGKVLNSHH